MPPCGYTLTNSFSWTIDAASPISVDPDNDQAIRVVSLDKDKLGSHTVTLTNDITYPTQSFAETETITFDVTIIDPCLTTTVNSAVFTPTTLTVTNGETADMTYTDVTDSVEVDNNIDTLCGSRSYTIYNNDEINVHTDWVTLSGPSAGVYTITATPTLDSLVGANNFKLLTVLDLYTNESRESWSTITVNVQGAACDQNGLEWDASAVVEQTIDVSTGPTTVNIAPYTPNVASKTATPQMRACAGSFDETYTLAVVEQG